MESLGFLYIVTCYLQIVKMLLLPYQFKCFFFLNAIVGAIIESFLHLLDILMFKFESETQENGNFTKEKI